jgi:hypothetical protein
MAPPKTRKRKAASPSRGDSPSVPFVPPRKKRKAAPGLGVTHAVSSTSRGLETTARYAGHTSKLFPHGGAAFEVWCNEKGINSREKRSTEDWSALLEEFANRPIHGLRRGEAGGNHRANARDLRS